ncbi:hypothetical protein MMC18_002197 [Xylographa bjoerkii]|nr:hypothetical protein [Xylographa bjoerkii]
MQGGQSEALQLLEEMLKFQDDFMDHRNAKDEKRTTRLDALRQKAEEQVRRIEELETNQLSCEGDFQFVADRLSDSEKCEEELSTKNKALKDEILHLRSSLNKKTSECERMQKDVKGKTEELKAMATTHEAEIEDLRQQLIHEQRAHEKYLDEEVIKSSSRNAEIAAIVKATCFQVSGQQDTIIEVSEMMTEVDGIASTVALLQVDDVLPVDTGMTIQPMIFPGIRRSSEEGSHHLDTRYFWALAVAKKLFEFECKDVFVQDWQSAERLQSLPWIQSAVGLLISQIHTCHQTDISSQYISNALFALQGIAYIQVSLSAWPQQRAHFDLRTLLARLYSCHIYESSIMGSPIVSALHNYVAKLLEEEPVTDSWTSAALRHYENDKSSFRVLDSRISDLPQGVVLISEVPGKLYYLLIDEGKTTETVFVLNRQSLKALQYIDRPKYVEIRLVLHEIPGLPPQYHTLTRTDDRDPTNALWELWMRDFPVDIALELGRNQ